MRKVKVVTDSTADLPKEILEARGIEAIPVHITLGDKNFLDDGKLSSEEAFEIANTTGTMSKAFPVIEREYEECFQEWLRLDYDIIYIGISTKLSDNVQNAIAAAVTVTTAMKVGRERISVVNSMSLFLRHCVACPRSGGYGGQRCGACRDNGAHQRPARKKIWQLCYRHS